MDKKKIESTHILIEHTPGVTEIINAIGQEEVHSIMISSQISLEIKFETPKQSHVNFQLIKGFISVLSTEHPTKVHREIVNATLKLIDESFLTDAYTLDIMARKLVEHCKILNSKIKVPKDFQSLIIDQQEHAIAFDQITGRVENPLAIVQLKNIPPHLESTFEQDNMFIWDKAFLDTLKSTGKHGKKAANKFQESFKKRLTLFKQKSKSPLHFWFNTSLPSPEKPFHLSPALQILADSIFKDIVSKQLNYIKNNVAAVTHTVQKNLSLVHSPKSKIERRNTEKGYAVALINEQYILAFTPIPITTQPRMISSTTITTKTYKKSPIEIGMDKLRSVVACKLYRFLIRYAFNQYQAQKTLNITHLILDRGLNELAELLNIKSKRQIEDDLGYILQAYAFGIFDCGLLKGNLLTLNVFKSKTTGRENGMIITIGPALCPNFIHQAQQTIGPHELLVAVPVDPPLINPTTVFANQYNLQMLIMAEFSNQSKSMAEHNKIHLPQSFWEQAATKCQFPTKRISELIPKLIDRWTRNSNWNSKLNKEEKRDIDDGKQFLIKLDDDHYTLAPTYEKERLFYIDQGKRRIRNSERANSKKHK
jgi:hypothetical protein